MPQLNFLLSFELSFLRVILRYYNKVEEKFYAIMLFEELIKASYRHDNKRHNSLIISLLKKFDQKKI